MSFTVDKDGNKHYTMKADPAKFGVVFMGQKPKEEKEKASPPEPLDPLDNSVTIVNPE